MGTHARAHFWQLCNKIVAVACALTLCSSLAVPNAVAFANPVSDATPEVATVVDNPATPSEGDSAGEAASPSEGDDADSDLAEGGESDEATSSESNDAQEPATIAEPEQTATVEEPVAASDEAAQADEADEADDSADEDEGPAVASSYAGGAGTADDPYRVSNAEELRYFAQQVEAGEDLTASIALTASIDLMGNADNQWSPIGDSSHAFAGTFDGRGYTISGLYIDASNPKAGTAALFAYVGNNVVLKNLTVEGSIALLDKVGYGAGFVATDGDGTSKTLNLENLVNKVNVSGGYYSGGLFGYAQSNSSIRTINVTNCVNYGNITGVYYAGGLVGSSPDCTFNNCVNYGSVSKYGIAYFCNGAGGMKLVGCINAGYVESNMPIYRQKDSYAPDFLFAPYWDNNWAVTGRSSEPMWPGTKFVGEVSDDEFRSAAWLAEHFPDFEYVPGGDPMPATTLFGKPVIVSQPEDVEAQIGQTATFTVAAQLPEGNGCEGSLSYRWYKSTDGETWSQIEGESSTLSYTLSEDDADCFFSCEVVNSFTDGDQAMTRSVRSEAAKLVIAEGDTSVAVDPIDDIKVSYGHPAHLVARATVEGGEAAYQWYQMVDGAWQQIAGATQFEYYATTWSAAQYKVVVSRVKNGIALESVDSNTVNVTVDGKTPSDGDTMEISSYADMLAFANIVNHWPIDHDGDTTCALNAVVTADIDLGGEARPWTPIAYIEGQTSGNASPIAYAGTFDGGFHIISGLYGTGCKRGGLFGDVNGATIKNFVLQGSVDTLSGTGAVAGYCYDGLFSHIRNEASVSAYDSISAHAAGITYCRTSCRVEFCANEGRIEARSTACGIVVCGTDGVAAQVSFCRNAGEIIDADNSTTAKYTYGIADKGTILNCVDYGSYGGLADKVYRHTAIGGTVNENCYFLETSSPYDATAERVDRETLFSQGFVENLQPAFVQSAAGPVLSWELGNAPRIAKQPTDLTLDVSEEGKIAIEASASDSATLEYQWYRGDGNDHHSGIAIEGATDSVFVIDASTDEQAVDYYCVVRNADTGAASVSDWTRVIVADQQATPKFVVQPESMDVAIDNVVAQVTAQAVVPTGSVEYQWYSCDENGNDLVPVAGTVDGNGVASYTLPKVSFEGVRYYVVTATRVIDGARGVTVKSDVAKITAIDYSAQLELPLPLFTLDVVSVLTDGTSSEYAYYTPLNPEQWQNTRALFTLYAKKSLFDLGRESLGSRQFTTSFLTTNYCFFSFNPGSFLGSSRYLYMEAAYSLTANGETRTATYSSPMVHVVNIDSSYSPQVLANPQDATYQVGAKDVETLTASHDGTNAVFKKKYGIDAAGIEVKWYRNETGVNDPAVSELVSTDAAFTPDAKSVGRAYYFFTVAYQYKQDGEILSTQPTASECAEIAVVDDQPAAQPEVFISPAADRVCTMGDVLEPLTAEISFMDAGVGDVTYAWYKSESANGTDLADDLKVAEGTADTPVVECPVNTAAAGVSYYYCVVTNTFQHVKVEQATSARVKVTVNEPDAATPSIAKQPMDQNTEVGTAVSVSVEATTFGGAIEGLSYQWYQVTDEGEILIEGATENTLTVTPEEAGSASYYCVVTSVSDSGEVFAVASNKVTVTVAASACKVFYIATAEDLATWRETLDFGTGQGTVVYLTQDIDMRECDETAAWSAPSRFDGTFDGQGHSLTASFVSDGMFKDLYGTVENLTLLGAMNVTAVSSVSGKGAVAVHLYGAMRNVSCQMDINISAPTVFYVGGLANMIVGSGAIVDSSEFSGSMTVVCNGAYNIGGIAAESTGIIRNCCNDGDISVSSTFFDTPAIAGIATMNGSSARIENCYNSGRIDIAEAPVGSAVAAACIWGVFYGTVTNCYYLEGTVEGDSRCTALSAEELADPAFAEMLGDAFKPGVDRPALAWQTTVWPVLQQVSTLPLYVVQGTPASAYEPLVYRMKDCDGATLSYQWYQVGEDGGMPIEGATADTFHPATDTLGTFNYYCVATLERNGLTWQFQSLTAEVHVVSTTPAATPQIAKQPASLGEPVMAGKTAEFTVEVAPLEEVGAGELTYQWYRLVGETPDPARDARQKGATEAVFAPVVDREDAGSTVAFYCVVTNTFEGKMAVTISDPASVEVAAQVIIDVVTVGDFYEQVYVPAQMGDRFEGVIIRLTADEYDFASDDRTKELSPLYSKTADGFAGKFYGNGAVLKNLKINASSSQDHRGGLFGTITGSEDDPAVVCGLTLQGSLTVTTSSGSSTYYVGSLAGYAEHAEVSQIVNDLEWTISTVNAKRSFGGIVGFASDCIVTACANHTSFNAYGPVGGIIGETERCQVAQCSNAGDIQMYPATARVSAVGGIVGNADDATVIENCYAAGALTLWDDTRSPSKWNTAKEPSMAGIAAGSGGIVRNCYASCTVSQATKWNSGMWGVVPCYPVGSGKVENSYALKGAIAAPQIDNSVALASDALKVAADKLNSGQDETIWVNRADDYPALWWEAPADVAEAWTVESIAPVEWTGAEACPAVSVVDGDGTPVDAALYGVSYENNIDRGAATVIVTPCDPHFTGELRATFEIVPMALKAGDAVAQGTLVYNGTMQAPQVVVAANGVQLVEGEDYSVSTPAAINAGTYTATVVGAGNYAGEVEVTFAIAKAPLTVTANSATKAYGASDPAWGYTVSALANPLDRVLSVSVSRAAGEEANGLYAITPSNAIVVCGNTVVTDNYAITYTAGFLTIGPNNDAAMGGATTTTPGTSAGSGSTTVVEKPVVVTPTPTKAPTLAFASKTITKTIGSAAFDCSLSKERTDGDVTYASSNTSVAKVDAKTGKVTLVGVGSATITATAKAGYAYKAGKATVTIKVTKPARAVISSTTGAKKAATVKYKKVANASGYEIQFATNKTFKKNLKKATVTKGSTLKKKVSKLKAKTKYYVRVRAYVKVNGKKIYGSWSKVGTVRTK